MEDLKIQRALGRIEGKLDGFLTRMEATEKDHEDLEHRTRSLEVWRWKAAGVLLAVMALAGFVLA